LRARFYKVQPQPPGTNVQVHILGSDGSTELTTPFVFDISINNAWNDADLSRYNIVVSGDFYIAIKYLTTNDPYIGWDNGGPDDRSYIGSPGSWTLFSAPGGPPDGVLMIRVEISSAPVGGVLYSVDKLSILTPWLLTVGITGFVALALLRTRKR
jgi:hypothetical protein